MYNGYGFGSLVNQNNVNTNYSSQTPTMPGYAGIDKLKFADMRTPQDQIHWLYLYALQLSQNFITREEAQALVDAATEAMKAYSDEQDAKQDEAFAQDQARQDADVLKRYYYLLDLINETGRFNGSCFDPTIGHERNIKKVLERVYDFDRLFALTAGDWDGDYKLTASAFDAQGTKARDYDVDYALVHYNDSRKTVTDTPQSTYFVRMLKRMVGGGEGSILTFNAPMKQDGENITLAVDDSLKVENDVLGVNAEKPISTDGGAVSLAHDATLKVTDGQLGVAPATAETLGCVKIGEGITVAADGTISASSGSEVNVIAPLVVDTAPTYNDDTTNVAIGEGAGTTSSYGTAVGCSAQAAYYCTAVGCYAQAPGDDSIAVGKSAESSGKNSVAVGYDAHAESSNSVAIGSDSHATTDYEFSIGSTTTTRRITHVTDPTEATDAATKNYVDTAITTIPSYSEFTGYVDARIAVESTRKAPEASGSGAIAVGVSAGATGIHAISIGAYANAARTGGIAIGSGTQAYESYSIALGYDAFAKNSDSVAIGSDSQTTTDYEFSIGNATITRRITHVTAPIDATDAATKNYVDTAIAGTGITVAACTGLYGSNGSVSGLDADNSHIDLVNDSGTYHAVHGSLSFTVPSGGFTGFLTGIATGTASLSTRDIYALAFVPSEAAYDAGGSIIRHRFRLAIKDGYIALEVVDSPFTAVSEMPITITF